MKILNYKDIKINDEIYLNNTLCTVTNVNEYGFGVSGIFIDYAKRPAYFYDFEQDQEIVIYYPENEEEITLCKLGMRIC